MTQCSVVKTITISQHLASNLGCFQAEPDVYFVLTLYSSMVKMSPVGKVEHLR